MNKNAGIQDLMRSCRSNELPCQTATFTMTHLYNDSLPQRFTSRSGPLTHFPNCEPSHSFKLPLWNNFPVNHVSSQPSFHYIMSLVNYIPSQFSTTVPWIPFTVSPITDSIPIHSLLIRCVQLFNRSTIQ